MNSDQTTLHYQSESFVCCIKIFDWVGIVTTLVLLDLDKTILSCNSAKLWISREWKHGKVSLWQLLQSLGWLSLYHWGKADVSDFLRSVSMWMKDEPESDLQHRTCNFWEESIRYQIRTEMREIIEWHRAQGHVLALLTASSNYLSELVAAELNIPHVLCNRVEVEAGLLTGYMLEPLCFGSGKILHAIKLGEELGLDWTAGYFYTDSFSDLPVLEAVTHPKVVCPDPRLEREAQSKGWEILRF